MNGSPSPAVPLPWRLAGHAATLVALAVLAWVIATWGWRWFGPAPPPAVVNLAIPDPAAALVAANVFGAGSSPAPAAGPTNAVTADFRLLGVLAEANGRGRALFRLADGSARFVGVGETVDGAITLIGVRPDGVTVRDAGSERTVLLRSAKTASTPVSAAPQPALARGVSCTVPAGFRGAVVKLNAELLQGMIKQPEAWSPIVEPRDGALVVREEAGFAAMIGLKRGDRLELANGIALRSVDDVVSAVLRPLTGNQSVRVEGSRGGERRELLIQNAGTCPG